MAQLNLPDGTKLRIPDGLSSDQVSAILTAREAQATEQRKVDAGIAAQGRMNPVERFAMGVARPVFETAYGIQELAGKELSPEQRYQLAVLRGNKGVAGTAGRVTGEIAAFAAPGGVASRGVRALPAAVGRFARVPAEVGVAAGMEALKSPTDERSRGQAAVEGAIGAGIGAGVGAVAAPLLRGVQPTAQAQRLIDRDIPLTPGMAKGGWLQSLEERLASVPGFSGALRNRQREAVNAWNRNLLNKVTPDAEVSAAGHQGFREATDAFTNAYNKLWSGEIRLDMPVLAAFWQDTVNRARYNLAPESADTIASTLRRLMDTNLSVATGDGINVAGQAISKTDDLLRAEAVQAARRGEANVGAYYEQARRQLKELLPKEVREQWAHLDGLYRQFATLRRAAGYKGAAAQEGVFTPNQLLSASIAADKSAGKGGVARGMAPLQQEATQALKVMGDNLPGQALGTAEKLTLPLVGAAALVDPVSTATAYGTARAVYSPWMRDWLIGPHDKSRALANALRRSGVSPASFGAALEE